MLKVLHVAKYYPPVPGGMERIVQTLCGLAPDRIESSVLAYHTGPRTVVERIDGVVVTRAGTLGQAGSVPIAPGLPGLLRAARADVMILHEPNPWALLCSLAARPRMPLGIWFHSEVIRHPLQYRLFYAPVARPSYRRARRFIVSSPVLGARARALQPYRDRVRVVPFGIDAGRWRATPEVQRRASEIRARANRPIVLFAGRLVPYKGVEVLLRAAAPLSVHVAIVGEGPMRARWEETARHAGGDARVEFTGGVSETELAAWFHACDLFVLPSVTAAEAFGVVQLEAMACGKPVISTSVASGVSWVNVDDETGLVVPPGEAAAMRAALTRLLEDPERRRTMGAAGRRRVAEEFSLESMARRFVAVCEEIAEGRPC